MSKENNVGPAFPTENERNGGKDGCQCMARLLPSLRDYFAAKAMQGFVSSYPESGASAIAQDAYDMADAMLRARES